MFTNFWVLHDNVGLMQVGHGFDAVVIFIEGGGYSFSIIGFKGLGNGVLVVAVYFSYLFSALISNIFVMCVY